MDGNLHAQAALYPEKEIPVEVESAALWTRASFLDAVKKKIVPSVRRIEIHCHSCPSLSHVTTLTAAPRRPVLL